MLKLLSKFSLVDPQGLKDRGIYFGFSVFVKTVVFEYDL